MLGNPRLSRVVGYALHGNRDPEVPCHRVVNRKGSWPAPFSSTEFRNSVFCWK
ncbi:MAG: MGMT family protein [Clostridia bacterium]